MTSFILITIYGLAGLGGVLLSNFIRRKKTAKEILVCPAGFDCESVIHSKYSKFLGIPVENLGILYYLSVTIGYGVFLFSPERSSDVYSFFMLSLTVAAFLFSVYLTFIQAVVLREWCTLCLLSALLSTLIFISIWSITSLDIISFADSILEIWSLTVK